MSLPVACGVTVEARRRPGYRRPHRGKHVCVERGPHPGWHRCWCGYLWGDLNPALP